ncbi:MAG: hypothetical protein H0V01_15065 [Bacteroidetes bacterium]|nr:hypothetical protein [Bacteroidota bacterium]HET6245295.1 hypothetical protein [Bacteroidia bacterium]
MDNVKYLSERVSVSQTKESLSIVITPDVEPLKQTLLSTWVVFWSFAGLVILTQIFGEYSREQKTFMFIWLLFWAYFEYVTVYAWVWKKYGFEKLTIMEGKLNYRRFIKGKGKMKIFNISSIKDINITQESANSIFSNLNNSYWVVGGERISIDENSNKTKFGIKLTNTEAVSVVKLIKKYL